MMKTLASPVVTDGGETLEPFPSPSPRSLRHQPQAPQSLWAVPAHKCRQETQKQLATLAGPEAASDRGRGRGKCGRVTLAPFLELESEGSETDLNSNFLNFIERNCITGSVVEFRGPD